MKIQISIIIPIYNVENHLSFCLSSAVNQTLHSIEIICVNDGSTDNSLSIIKAFARKDKRIRIFTLPRNHGTCYARKVGVNAARGRFLMFLDGDDSLHTQACEILNQQMLLNESDILQFGTHILAADYMDSQRIARSTSNLLPWKFSLQGKAVLDGCFKNHLYRFTLWNKIYKTRIVKQAFRNLSNDYLVKAEDCYSYFVIAYYANSYSSTKLQLYNYNFGAGITGRQNLSLEHLDLYCQNMASVKALAAFIRKKHLIYYRDIFLPQLRIDMLLDCLTKYFVYLPEELQIEGMPILRKYWTEDELKEGFTCIGITF